MNTPAKPEIDRFIFLATLVFVVGVSLPLVLAPQAGDRAVGLAFDFVTGQLGILHVWSAVANLAFLGWLALGRYGTVRLARAGESPDFSTFSWAAMLFCGGMGTGILYWATIEWAYYYTAPPFGVAPRSAEAVEWATSYPIFHWGPTGWAFYCMPALAIGYSYFVRGAKSLRLSDACRVVIGDRADGALGRIIDLIFMVGLIGAAGTGIGLAVPLISAELGALLGFQESFRLNLAVVLLGTGLFSVSVYSGLERGIKRLSNLNVILALAMVAFIVAAGPTLFVLETGTSALGQVAQNFIRLNTWTDSIRNSGFVESWTIFYWAWWIALGPFMGMFIARISRGRSIREVIFGVLFFGSVGCAVFFIVFGNYALHLELSGIMPVTALLQNEGAPRAIVAVVGSLPFGRGVLALFCLVSIVFMATTYDSAAYTLALGATRRLGSDEHPARWHRLFWAFAISLLPAALMLLGGLRTFQTAVIVASVPLFAVGILLAVSLVHGLRSAPAPNAPTSGSARQGEALGNP